MHYYQHHIGDFIKDTANLSDHQIVTYMRLLWSYYDTEKPISGDLEDIAFAMRSDEKTVRLLLRHYFKETDDGWTHSRCDREIAEYRSKSEKARSSATARWKNANGMRTHTERNASVEVIDANQEPITNNQEIPPIPPAGGVVAVKDKPPEPIPELPEFVDRELWGAWVHCRKGKRISALSAKIAIGQLSDWNSAGLDANSALRNAVIGGWQGLFKPDKVQKKEVQSQSENPRPQWAIDAGFANVWEANNARCYQRNAHEFRNGEKVRGLVL